MPGELHLVANFDCERTWSERPALPVRVQRRLARLAPLMRGLVARPDDDVVIHAIGMATQATMVGSRPAARKILQPGRTIAFGAHPALTAHPERNLSPDRPLAPRDATALDGAAREALLLRYVPTVAAARTGANRRDIGTLTSKIRRAMGASGTREAGPSALDAPWAVDTLDQVRAHLATGLAEGRRHWVLKPSCTAAGRDRIVLDAGGPSSRELDVAAGLLRDHPDCILEPWMPRVLDVGVAAMVGDDALWVFPPHEIIATPTGGFAGIRVHRDADWLPPHWRAQLQLAVEVAAHHLAALGFVGPMGIDTFAYQDSAAASATAALRPLSEVNPRATFGLLAHGWAAKLGSPGVLALHPSLLRQRHEHALPLSAPPHCAWFVPEAAAAAPFEAVA